jgi:hypothetical protein
MNATVLREELLKNVRIFIFYTFLNTLHKIISEEHEMYSKHFDEWQCVLYVAKF